MWVSGFCSEILNPFSKSATAKKGEREETQRQRQTRSIPIEKQKHKTPGVDSEERGQKRAKTQTVVLPLDILLYWRGDSAAKTAIRTLHTIMQAYTGDTAPSKPEAASSLPKRHEAEPPASPPKKTLFISIPVGYLNYFSIRNT